MAGGGVSGSLPEERRAWGRAGHVPITLEEVQEALRNMKRGKAPGPDALVTDVLKDLDREGVEAVA